jgi:hypothetical protein
MRKVSISTDEFSGSTRFQADDEIGHDDLAHDISYHETLGCTRNSYERIDIKKSPVVKSAEPTAQVSWSTAQRLQGVSDVAFALEAYRRGLCLVSAKNILSGRYESGKRRNKSQRGGAAANLHRASGTYDE